MVLQMQSSAQLDLQACAEPNPHGHMCSNWAEAVIEPDATPARALSYGSIYTASPL